METFLKIFTRRYMLILICISTGYIRTEAELLPTLSLDQLEKTHKKDDLSFEQVLLTIKDLLTNIDIMYENTALDVKNGALHITDKEAFLKNILIRRDALNHIRFSIPSTQQDLSALAQAVEGIKALLQDLHTAIKTEFKDFQEFNLDNYATRGTGVQDLQSVVSELEIQQKILDSVNIQASKIGLTRRNRMARWIDKGMIRPFYQYNVGKRAFNTLLAAGLCFELLYVFDVFKDVSWIGRSPVVEGGRWLKGITAHLQQTTLAGGTGAISPATTAQLTSTSAEVLFQIHKFFGMFVIGQWPILAWMSASTKAQWAEDFQKCTDWGKNKVTAWWNRQKGGQYRLQADRLEDKKSEVFFDQLIGCNAAKEEFKKIFFYTQDPEKADRLGMRPTQGILCVGDTRTGKSWMVWALVCEIRRWCKEHNKKPFSFLQIPQAAIREYGIDTIFYIARRQAPCIIFIDEIDLIGLNRSTAANGKGDNLADFLTHMSGAVDKSPDPIFVIGTTNDPQSIDLALRQRGRFGCIIPFTYPNMEERLEFLVKELTQLALHLESFDLNSIARLTEGCSFEDLKALISAALQHARMKNKALSQKHLEKAFYQEICHISTSKSFAVTSAQEQAIIAANLAGNALAYTLFDTGSLLSLITTRPVKLDMSNNQASKQTSASVAKQSNYIRHGGLFTHHLCDRIKIYSDQEVQSQCKAFLAGPIAEKILLGNTGYSYNPANREAALKIAINLASKGLTKSIALEQLPAVQQQEFITRALQLLEDYEKEIENIFQKNKDALQLIFTTLTEQGTLSGDQVRMLYQYCQKHPQEPVKQ